MKYEIKYIVVIKNPKNEIVKEFEPLGSERQAERLERGVNINLDTNIYHTDIITKQIWL